MYIFYTHLLSSSIIVTSILLVLLTPVTALLGDGLIMVAQKVSFVSFI